MKKRNKCTYDTDADVQVEVGRQKGKAGCRDRDLNVDLHYC